MPEEVVMRVQLTDHMAYDCAPEGEKSGACAPDFQPLVDISLQSVDSDKLEGHQPLSSSSQD